MAEQEHTDWTIGAAKRPVSVPSAQTVLNLLKAEGDAEGLAAVRKAVRGWRCSNCEIPSRSPGVVREGKEVTLYCPFCSGVRVRPERIEVTGEGFSILGPR